jgi:porphobilinogen deaminase
MRLRIGSRDHELALWQANHDLLIYEATMGWGAFAGTELEQKLKKSD